MGLKATVSLDLPGASGSQRQKFYDTLAGKSWTKIEGATTTFTAGFEDAATFTGIVNATKADFNKAATESGVKYTGQLVIGSAPISIPGGINA